MPHISGSQVSVEFMTFAGKYPALYYGAGEAGYHLASVNAGSSNDLIVGSEFINGRFLAELNAAGQKQASSKGKRTASKDDYQSRHKRVLEKALADPSRTAFETFAATDPCLFCYAYAAPVTTKRGWNDGICFVDVFDASLCPAGNTANAAMLYVAPPHDKNYANQAAFLQAIEATGRNIVQTLAGYNAVAGQKLPVIEALRLPLFSSDIYNRRWDVPAGDVAAAIWRGLLAGQRAQPNSGLRELQLPTGSGAQPALFGVVKGDPALAPVPSHLVMPSLSPPLRGIGGMHGGVSNLLRGSGGSKGAPVEPEEIPEEDLQEFEAEENAPPETAQDPGVQALAASSAELQSAVSSIRAKGQAWTNKLTPPAIQGAVALNPQGNYGSVAGLLRQEGANYEGVGSEFGGVRGETLTNANDFETAIASIPDGKAADVRAAVQRAAKTLRDMNDTVRNAETALANARSAAAIQKAQQDLALCTHVRRVMRESGSKFAEVARREFTERRALEARAAARVRMAKILGGVAAVAGTLAGVIAGLVEGLKPANTANTIELPYGPAPKGDAPDLTFDVITANNLEGMVDSVSVTADAGMTGTWAVANNAVQFKAPADPAEVSTATYTLTLNNADKSTLSGKLTAFYATDVVRVASDRTAAVQVPVGKGFAFVGTPPSGMSVADGAAGASPTVTFTPPANFTAPYVHQAFQDTRGMAIVRSVVILFPAQPLKSSPMNRTASSLEAIPGFVETDKVRVVLLSGMPLQEKPEVPVTGGKWTAAGGTITFTPDTLPATASTVSVDYAFRRGPAVSAAAKAEVDYPAAGGVQAADATAYAVSRSKAVTIAVTGAMLTGTPAVTNGTWSASATSVTFTPSTALANVPGEVSESILYTVAGGSAMAKLTVVFVAPANRKLDSVSRVGGVVNLTPAASELSLPGGWVVALWDGTQRQEKIVSGGHEWSLMGRTIVFKPSTSFFSEASAQVQWVITDGTDNSPVAAATVNFSQAPAAFAIVVSGPIRVTIARDVKNFCYVAPGKTIKSVTLTNAANGVISVPAAASQPTIIHFDNGGSGARTVTGRYRVTVGDAGSSANDVTSNEAVLEATFTAAMSTRALPMAWNCLIPKSAAPGQIRVAKVLDNAEAFHGIDAASVKLAGPLNVGPVEPVAALSSDGKSMFVLHEGVWVVDTGGAISFHADGNFSGAPTPAAFTFADQKGTVSAAAAVVFDDELAALAGLPAKVAAVDEKAFWRDYRWNVARLTPKLSVHEFLAVTHAIAYGAKLAAKPGINPVSLHDYDRAYQDWLDGGQEWDDDPGVKRAVGLVTICQKLVEKAMPAGQPSVLTRYWRLQHMAYMAAQAMPPGGSQ